MRVAITARRGAIAAWRTAVAVAQRSPAWAAGAPLRVELDGERIADVRTLRTGTRLRVVAAEREPNGDRRGD